MTVGKLIKLLEKEDPKRIVVLQKDSEGNGYSILYSIWRGLCKEDKNGYVEASIEKLTPKLRREGFTEEDICGGKPALILVP